MGSVTKSQRLDKAGKKVTFYRAYVRRAGVSTSKVFTTATDAKKWLRENEHADALSAAGIAKRGTLAALIEDFVKAPPRRGTKYWTAGHLDFWNEQLGSMPVGAIARGDINGAVATLQNQTAMKATHSTRRLRVAASSSTPSRHARARPWRHPQALARHRPEAMRTRRRRPARPCPDRWPDHRCLPGPRGRGSDRPHLSHPFRAAKDACSAEPAFEFLAHALTHWPLHASQPCSTARCLPPRGGRARVNGLRVRRGTGAASQAGVGGEFAVSLGHRTGG